MLYTGVTPHDPERPSYFSMISGRKDRSHLTRLLRKKENPYDKYMYEQEYPLGRESGAGEQARLSGQITVPCARLTTGIVTVSIGQT